MRVISVFLVAMVLAAAIAGPAAAEGKKPWTPDDLWKLYSYRVLCGYRVAAK